MKKVFSLMIIVLFEQTYAQIDWKGNWAFACDFKNNDLANVQVRGEDCGRKCEETSGCTHFTWTTYKSGTCWMKKGVVSKANAFNTNDYTMVCGVLTSSIVNGLSNILATRHGANEIGACQLPAGDYTTRFPVALGDIAPLQYLRFNPDLCGHILTVDCGKGRVDIIVTNSNLGGGLDLYASTWNIATGYLPPGETRCSVELSSKNPFKFNEPKCFHATGEVNNAYYRNVGLLNVGNRIVTKATLNGKEGAHRGANPYYAFDGFADPNSQLVFFFKDGTSYRTTLSSCANGEKKQFWS